MTLAVMTRASLGHTGAPLTAGAATVAIYALITAGAVLRTVASGGLESYAAVLMVASLLWSGAFALFVLSYGPRLVKPLPRKAEAASETTERAG